MIVSLLDLPNEIIEGVFEYVQEDDILQLKLVNKAINLIIAGSVGIQYRVELFLAGLEDRRSDDPEPLGERLNKLRLWRSRWSQAGSSPPQTVTLPGECVPEKYCLCGGVFAMYSEGLIHFIRLPSPSRSVALVSWTTTHLGFEPVGNFAMDPDQDLLVLAERQAINILAIRIFDMHGRQHPQSFFRSLFLYIEELRRPGAFIKQTRITVAGPNVAILVVLELEHENRCQDSLWVFDWTSGWSRLRLERLDINNIAFLDGFHLATSSLDPKDGRSYRLGVHDLRQRSRQVFFDLPPYLIPTSFDPVLFCNRYPGPVSDFHGSSVSAIFVMAIHQRITKGSILVVVHPQALFAFMEQGDLCIPWEEWKNAAGLFAPGPFWGEPNDLQITTGLRLISSVSMWVDPKNPKLRLHTFQPWIPPRENAKGHSLKYRTGIISFSLPGPLELLPLISDEHVLWISREDTGAQTVYSMNIFQV